MSEIVYRMIGMRCNSFKVANGEMTEEIISIHSNKSTGINGIKSC